MPVPPIVGLECVVHLTVCVQTKWPHMGPKLPYLVDMDAQQSISGLF